MKVSLNWLRELVDIELSVDELVDKIGAQLGAVEEVVDLGKKYQGIVVAKVVECEKHPNADKLSLCKIDDGKKVKNVERDKDGLVQVVCGAPNVRAGQLVAWLPPGSTVPASFDKEPFVLEARELRGKVSNGMLASASELALSDDHNGIVELSYGEPGEDFAQLVGLNDHIIDIENKMFTHRPDCFGILGIAREVAGITGQPFKSPEWYTVKPKVTPSETKLPLTVENHTPEDLVPRFMARVIDDVEVKSSPVWMQAYLARVGIRPINNIVDVTNYVMCLTGQPLHAYDYDKLCAVARTQNAMLEARLSKKGDKLTLLNGKPLKFEDDETILITSNNIPVGVGGVMGGADTEVDENTKRIVLECASFDMYAIRRASMRHGLFTDAVTRFNKGQSSLQNPAVLYKATGWMMQLAGGKVGETVDVHKRLNNKVAVHVTAEFINERLGLDMDIKHMAKLLTNVEFEVRINGPTLAVTPPFWRTDIEIAEDLVEEVGRLYGFDHLPFELPQRSIKPGAVLPRRALKQRIRDIMTTAGANEIYSYSFVHGNLLDKAGQDKQQAYRLSNALSPDLQYYRLSLTPSLLEKVHLNVKAGHDTFVLYEIGKAHQKGVMNNDEPDVPAESQLLSCVVTADKKHQPSGAGYFMARRYLDYLLGKLHIKYEVRNLNTKPKGQMVHVFEAERSAEILVAGEPVGFIGEYTASARRQLKLPEFTAGFELQLDKLLTAETQPTYKQLSRFPSVSQDLCLRTEVNVPYAALERVVRTATADAQERVEITPIDIYRKDTSKHKQTTFRITVTSYKRTLTDEYVTTMLQDIVAQAGKELSAERI